MQRTTKYPPRLRFLCAQLCAVLALLWLPLTVCAQSTPKPIPERLVVGSELNFPPFALSKKDGSADGFTVELWKVVAQELRLKSSIQTGPFHEILQHFKSADIDVMINLAQSDERRAFCFFSVPHVTMYGALFVRKGESSIRSERDVPGKELIVLNRDLAHDYALQQNWGNLKLVDDAETGFKLLAAGRHDAMLIGKLVGLNTIRELNLLNIEPVKERVGFGQKFAFAVKRDRPGSAELMAGINEGLAIVKANGTYDALYEKWFGILEPRTLDLSQLLAYVAPFLLISTVALGAYLWERHIRLRLKQTVSLLNATLGSTADGILAVDAQGRILALNDRLKLLGVKTEEIHPDQKGGALPVFEQVASQLAHPASFRDSVARIEREPNRESFDRLLFPDGRCFEVISQPQTSGVLKGGRVWSFRNVTQIERAAKEVRKLNTELEERVLERTRELQAIGKRLERLSHVAAKTRNGVVICTPDKRIEWVNQSFEAISGWQLEEIVGKRPGDFLQGEGTDPSVVARVSAALASNEPVNFTILNYAKTGRKYWVEVDISPVFDKQGELISLVSVQVDVTERRESEEKLLQLNDHLQEALRSRDAFMATMSHELRTPLHGVLGLAETLIDESKGPLTAAQRKSLMGIHGCGVHLLAMINDILDIAKAENSGISLQLGLCDAEELCRSAMDLVGESAQKKNLQIQLSVAAELPVRADFRRLKQVLTNLLSNAVKFTQPPGIISLTAYSKGEETLFEIRDTGIGISADNLSKLFRPFVQLDERLDRDHSGTGLGLALVKQIVDAHSGTVDVTSVPGQGSCFTVRLPNDPEKHQTSTEPPQTPAAAAPSASLADIRVLLAEDNQLNLETIKEFLELQGAVVMAAQDGFEAVEIAEKQHPMLVLMDVQMPGMDGLEATRRIRRFADPQAASVPIISLTALAMPGDQERCLEAGCNDYLLKPVPLKTIANVVRNRARCLT